MWGKPGGKQSLFISNLDYISIIPPHLEAFTVIYLKGFPSFNGKDIL